VKFGALLGAIGAVLVAGPCHAGTMTQTQSVALTATSWSQTLLFDQWDPAEHVGQKLVQVDISIGGSVYNVASWQITKGTRVSITSTVESWIDAYRTWGDNGLLVESYTTGSATHSNLSAPPTKSGVDTLFDVGYPELYSTTTNSELSAFRGTGTVGIALEATGVQGYAIIGTNATGSCSFETTRASADAEVTYTWVEIPEPTSCALFLLGAMGLGLYSRRRRSAE
jgi:hypothetical protein